MVKYYVLILIMCFSYNMAFADCTFNGITYPEGTVIGPYVCSDGIWIER